MCVYVCIFACSYVCVNLCVLCEDGYVFCLRVGLEDIRNHGGMLYISNFHVSVH